MVLQIAFSPDGKLLATVREGQQIMLWDVKAKRLLTTFA
jgi:WD40 repeat protein